MNYLLQIKGYWVVQDAHSIGVEETGLYFYLLEISNKLNWMNPFKRNNSKIMADLGIKDRRTLDKYRNRLQQAGILSFNTRNGDANVAYSLNDLSIFCTGFGTGTRIGSGTGARSGSGTDNINQTETKPIDIGEASSPPKKSKVDTSKSMDDRKKDFGLSLQPHVETYGRPMIADFYAYWIEPNKTHTKMRFESESFFDVKRRLSTWNRNNFNKSTTSQQEQPSTDDYLSKRRDQEERTRKLTKD